MSSSEVINTEGKKERNRGRDWGPAREREAEHDSDLARGGGEARHEGSIASEDNQWRLAKTKDTTKTNPIHPMKVTINQIPFKPPAKPLRPSSPSKEESISKGHEREWGKQVTYLGGEELGEDVGEDTALGDDDGSEEFVEFLVVADGELEMTGDDTRLLVVAGGVTGELEDLRSEVWKESA